MTGGYLFPPELVPLLRARLPSTDRSLVAVDDTLLTELLTVVFFAGLLTHERLHHPIRVAFAPHSGRDALAGGSPLPTPMLIYRWSTLRFDPDRSFTVAELAKLAVVTRGDRMYTKVEVSSSGMRVVGIARQGVTHHDRDPYLEVVAGRPGLLSVRHADRLVLEYEHGRINENPLDVFTEAGCVRRALEACARNAGIGSEAVPDYLGAVRALVREMAAHGTGGILIVSAARAPRLPIKAAYRTESDAAIGELLPYLDASADARRGSAAPTHAATQLRRVLRDTFRTEAERWVTEFGGFTAMDGATVLDCALGLRGFGVILPVAKDVEVVEALDGEAIRRVPYDLTIRGTRHRAAVNYALDCPGSVVFLASHDGPVCCLVADEAAERVHLWRLGDGTVL